jgi:PqqD family protein of HPr-rel-A system
VSLDPTRAAPGAAHRWRACRDFRRKEWADGAVLYDPASGDTHHLTPAAACILGLLDAGPRAREELAQCVLSSGLIRVEDASLDMLDATLERLHHLGLIEPIAD